MKALFKLVIILSLIQGCVSAPKVQKSTLSSEEKEYIELIQKTKISFEIPSDKLEQSWGRAQGFIGKYSGMKIHTNTDYVIETYSPIIDNFAPPIYGYRVSRITSGDNEMIDVICAVNKNGVADFPEIALMNARILSYYIKNGVFLKKFVNSMVVNQEE